MNNETINRTAADIAHVLIHAARETFGTQKRHKTNTSRLSKRKVNKPWFNNECKEKRKTFFKAKNRYKKFKTPANKISLQMTSKNYKKMS